MIARVVAGEPMLGRFPAIPRGWFYLGRCSELN